MIAKTRDHFVPQIKYSLFGRILQNFMPIVTVLANIILTNRKLVGSSNPKVVDEAKDGLKQSKSLPGLFHIQYS